MDDELYRQTLDQYNDPAFAQQYAQNIADQNEEKTLHELLTLVPTGAKVLDVACAAGRDSKLILEKGYQIVGIDQSAALLDIAKKEVPSAEFVQGDFTDLPFSNESFDAIWCNAALVHLPSQGTVQKSLTEFQRVLKPGGFIAINTKARLLSQGVTAVKKDVLSGKNRYFRYQAEDELVRLCEQAGFKILKHKVTNELDDPTRTIKRDENWLLIIAKRK